MLNGIVKSLEDSFNPLKIGSYVKPALTGEAEKEVGFNPLKIGSYVKNTDMSAGSVLDPEPSFNPLKIGSYVKFKEERMVPIQFIPGFNPLKIGSYVKTP